MNMIRHNNKRMQGIPPLYIGHMMQHLHHHVGNARLSKVKRAGTPAIQQTIQSSKRPPGTHFGITENAILRQTAIQTPSHKYRLIVAIQVRKTPTIKCHVRIVDTDQPTLSPSSALLLAFLHLALHLLQRLPSWLKTRIDPQGRLKFRHRLR